MKLITIVLCFDALAAHGVPQQDLDVSDNEITSVPIGNESHSNYVAIKTEREKHQSHGFQFYQPDNVNAVEQSVNASQNVNPLSMWLGSIPMFFAIQRGYANIVEELIKHNASVNVKNQNGSTPIQIAVDFGHARIVEILLRNNASVGIRHEDGWSLLHIAGAKGYDKIVELLLAHGIEVNAKDIDGNTVLHIAAMHEQTMNVVEILLEHSADINATNNKGKTPLMIAVDLGHREIAALLIENGCDLDVGNMRRKYEILSCIARVDRELANLLRQKGIPIDPDNSESWYQTSTDNFKIETNILNDQVREAELLIRNCVKNINDMGRLKPLLLAAGLGSSQMVQMLIELGANTDGSIYSEETPLDRAVTNNHVKVAEILLKNGANVQGQSNRYRDSTPLHVASSMLGSEAMVKLLIQNGAKVDATDAMIKTPLHLSRNYNVSKLLIENGADVNARESYGRTPLHLKSSSGDLGSVNLLIQNGADVNAKDTFRSWTPIHYAAFEDRKDVIRLLIEKGASVSARDDRGVTASEIADEQGFIRSARILKQAEEEQARSETKH